MSASYQIRVQIPETRREYSSIGTRTTSFIVYVLDGAREHVIELDDLDFAFLHEELSAVNGGVPSLTVSKFRLIDTAESVEERRIAYEKYLNETLESPGCVTQSILWVTLGLSASSGIRQRFLVRGDNVDRLEELSALTEEVVWLTTPPVVTSLLRLLQEQAWDIRAVASATATLSRITAQSDTARLVVETSTVPCLIRAAFSSTSPACIGLLADVASNLASACPQALFVYFQRDSGLTELIDLLDTQDALHPRAILGLSEILWAGVSNSKDVEIAVTDKASVGMALLNKLLVKGQRSETELVVTTLLAYLFTRGSVPEYGSKIVAVIDSVLADARMYRLRFADNFLRILVLLGKTDSDSVIKFGSFLVISKCLLDSSFFHRSLLYQPLAKRLKQLVFSGPDLAESTRAFAAEALVMLGPDELAQDLSESLEMEKHIKELVAGSFVVRIQKLNNFFIEANFDLSSRAIAVPVGGNHGAALQDLTHVVVTLLHAIDAEQQKLNGIHSRALNEVVSGMFQVKSLLKEVETVASADLAEQYKPDITGIQETGQKTESAQQELAAAVAALKEAKNEDAGELRKRITELKQTLASSGIKAELAELNEKRVSGFKNLQNVNRELTRLNGETFETLVNAVAQIDEKVNTSGAKIHQLKSALVKMKNEIDDLLEQIDEDTGSSPISP